jgi:hypothetical protein
VADEQRVWSRLTTLSGNNIRTDEDNLESVTLFVIAGRDREWPLGRSSRSTKAPSIGLRIAPESGRESGIGI